MVLRQHLRMRAQQFRHVQQQIAEIDRVQRRQPRLVGGIDGARLAGREIRVLGGGDARRRQATVLPALDDARHRRRHPAFGVESQRLHHLLHQPDLVVGIQDGEVGRQADERRVRAQHPRAQRMERAEPQPFHRTAEDRADPLAHLPRRLVGEGDRQHLAGRGAAGEQQMGEAGGQHARLAGAGAGEHQQRPVERFHRFPLGLVQAGEVIGHAGITSPSRGARASRRPADARDGTTRGAPPLTPRPGLAIPGRQGGRVHADHTSR